MNHLVKSNLDELLSDCGVIDAVSWQPPANMTYEKWADIGGTFQYIDSARNWWIGDWLNEGEKRYGEKYAQAIEVTGHKLDYLQQCAWVARQVKNCTRVQFLTWTHHRYVAKLNESAQIALLTFAAEHNLSSRDLLESVREYESNLKQFQPVEESPDDDPPFAKTQDNPLYTNDYDEIAEEANSYNCTEDRTVPFVAHTEKEILEAADRIRQEKRNERREDRAEKIVEISQNNKPLAVDDLDRLYPVIYADPPWRYEHSMTDNRKIENQYPTMSLQEICDLPVSDIAAPDAVLLLWTTSPKLAESMDVIDAWGFVYRTCIVWDKDRIGMGYYARQQHELLLVASRGSIPVPEPENRPASVIRIKRDNEHSVKPHEFYTLIERMYPEYDRIELFARNARDGWAAWGNQA